MVQATDVARELRQPIGRGGVRGRGTLEGKDERAYS